MGKKTAEDYNREYVGKVYGEKIINSYSHTSKDRRVFFWCTCLRCGSKIEKPVYIGNLKRNMTANCGKCARNNPEVYYKNEIGKIYNNWVMVLRFNNFDKYGNACFLCKCLRCGTEFGPIRLSSLKNRGINSCGCITESIGETNIKNILEENGVSYEYQKRFEDCKNINSLPFDFFVDGKWCVEFDGPQHNRIAWDGEKGFENRQKCDKIKNEYCYINNIPLIRIPYPKRDNMIIEDLIPETSKYLV